MTDTITPEPEAKRLGYYLTMEDLIERLQCSKATIYKMVRKGEFPAPIKLGRKAVWDEPAVVDALEALARRPMAENPSIPMATRAAMASAEARRSGRIDDESAA